MLLKYAVNYIRRLRGACHEVMSLPDSPRKIAQGVALGTALDFLPIPFISIPISFLLARMIKVNAVAAVMTVIFFKWAVPFFFAFDYYVGKMLLGGSTDINAGASIITASPGAWIGWIKLLGYPFLLGALINSLIFGVISYFLVKPLLEYYRRRKIK
ncbi:MAG: DUF2062 domain-containing protein [Bacillota bacterium]